MLRHFFSHQTAVGLFLFLLTSVTHAAVDNQWGTKTGLVPDDLYSMVTQSGTILYSVTRESPGSYSGYKRTDRYAISLLPGEKAKIHISAGSVLNIKVFTNSLSTPANAYLTAIQSLSASDYTFTVPYDSRYAVQFIYVGIDGVSPGDYSIYYTITSQITPANTAPAVTLVGDNPITIESGTAYTDPGATATDATDGTLTPVMTGNTVRPNQPGTYTVIWTATDSGGLSASATRTVNVTNPTYANWCAQHGMDGDDATETADPYHTGVSNLAAYAFGVDPQTPDLSQLPQSSIEGSYLHITYPRLKNSVAVDYSVEVSNDLKTWSLGAGFTEQVSVNAIDGGREQVVERCVLPISSAPARFIRVKVIRK